MLEGHRFAQREHLEMTAWLASILLAPWSTKPITVDDLLGRERRIDPKRQERAKKIAEETKALMRKLETAKIKRREVIGNAPSNDTIR